MNKKSLGLLASFLVFFVSNIGQPALADTNWKEDLNKSMKLLQKKDESNALPFLQSSLNKALREKKLSLTEVTTLEVGVAESTNFRFSQFRVKYGNLPKDQQKVKLKQLTESVLPDNRLLLAVFQKHLGDVEKTQTLRKSIQRLEEVSRKNG